MNTETIQQLVFECGLQTPTVVLPATALLMLCGWMLVRERKAIGLGWALGFWCLRAIALCVLVWMFLQPARMTETRSTLPKSVALVVDNSDSMNVIDPVIEGHGVRWQLANLESDNTDNSDDRDAQVALDSATLALDVAQSRWTLAQAQLQTGSNSTALRERFNEVAFALNRASILLGERFCDHWNDSSDQGRAKDFAMQCDDLAEFVTELDLKESKANSRDRIQTSLEYLQALVNLNRLTKTWSRVVSDTISQSMPSSERVDRRADVMQLVRQTESNESGTDNSHVSIQRFTFDEELKPVLSPHQWPKPRNMDSDESEFDVDKEQETQTPSPTNLTAAITQITQLTHRQSIQSVVFLTDGAHNAPDTASPVDAARKRNDLSISFVPIGSLKRPRDVSLYHVGHPRSVMLGDKILIETFVSASGFEGQTIDLQLRADDELIDQKQLSVDSEMMDLRHSFTVPTNQRGSIEFELRIVPLAGEASTTNNRAIFRVGVVRAKIRVMLADRISRWEYRYLDQLLFRDEHLEHEMILFDPRLRATGKLQDESALPVTSQAWNDYDVAVIGDLTPDQFPVESQESLVEFVKEKGGVAILIAGRSGMPAAFEDQPLAGLLPVQKSESGAMADKYHVSVNRLATDLESVLLDESKPKSELLWKQVFEEQPITWLSQYSVPRPSARRLLDAVPADAITSDGRNLATDPNAKPTWLCWQQLGAGRVVFLSAPDTYRLRYRRGDRLHHRFWAQLFRWITSSDPGSDSGLARLSTDKVSYDVGESILVSVFLSEPSGEPVQNAELQVSFQGGQQQPQGFELAADETQPGRYVAKVDDLQAGAYRVSLQDNPDNPIGIGAKVETFVNVVTSPGIERVSTTCNRPLMKQIAQASGGYVIPPTALAEWLTLQAGMPETISQTERVPLWNRWSCLWVAMGCLVTEWCVRRMKGLT
ncbi:hypothetical protein LF1_27850 [Rubripirellula obstinata]|uniref:VWFA domain-containing protein n=1 Tax=Rubripirellula obstinata TaxID=406547 RepID=A0A5B1CI62_9BACT|nr:hypothetical protein [Rubripirellula obstinata]KAA1260246.1 hypothetical protein LF1_27850 [Rubripirellula obstinata]